MYNAVIACTGMQCTKTQVLGNRCSIKNTFWPFLDYGFNAESKLRNLGFILGLNEAYLLKSQY